MFLASNKDSQGQPWKICLKTIDYCDRTNVYTKAIASRVFPTSSAEILRQQLPSVGMAGLQTSFPASSLPFLGAALQPLLARWQNLHLALGFFAGCLGHQRQCGHVVLWELWSLVIFCPWQKNLRLRTPQVAGRWSFFFPILLSCLGHDKLKPLHSCSSTSMSSRVAQVPRTSPHLAPQKGSTLRQSRAHGISNFGRQHLLFCNRGIWTCVPISIWMDEQQKTHEESEIPCRMSTVFLQERRAVSRVSSCRTV